MLSSEVTIMLPGFLAIILVKQTFGQTDLKFATPCVTPNNVFGYCVEIQRCQVFMDALRLKKKETFAFIRASRCGPSNENTEYPKICCGAADNFYLKENYVTTTPSRPASVQSGLQTKCGRQMSLVNRIFGGLDAELEDFPWMARLRHKRDDGFLSYGCSAFLISEMFVLTAAHCIRSESLAKLGPVFDVELGEYDTSTDPDCNSQLCAEPVQFIRAGEPIVHPNYTGPPQQYHDIAIVPLERPARLTQYVVPICLPHQKLKSRFNSAWVSGWGKTETKSFSEIKMKVLLQVVNMTTCAEIYRSINIKVIEPQICAGGTTGKDSCSGDSGGPLMAVEDDVWYVRGIVSFGKGCGKAGWPGIYTNIDFHVAWIEDTVKEYTQNPSKSRKRPSVASSQVNAEGRPIWK